MKIIAHRGSWKTSAEKNSIVALGRSFKSGFGVETDIRDYKGDLVISHDIPDQVTLSFAEFLKLYTSEGKPGYLALNIKSDGLNDLIAGMLEEYDIQNYFCFDMSIPDTLGYLAKGLNTYLRISEYESVGLLGERSQGIWLDSFAESWYKRSDVESLLLTFENVCIVSPELHGLEHKKLWEMIRGIKGNIILCTDFPDEAEEYFNE
jgi:hypothetical protein